MAVQTKKKIHALLIAIFCIYKLLSYIDLLSMGKYITLKYNREKGRRNNEIIDFFRNISAYFVKMFRAVKVFNYEIFFRIACLK